MEITSIEAFKLPNPEIEAEISYLAHKQGGRETPVGNGYRGQFHYDGRDWDAPQQFLNKIWCNPGETVQVAMQTASPDFHVGKLFVGKEFEIREGGTIVGKGKITKLLRDDFQFWDPKSFIDNLSPDIKPYSGDDLLGFKIDFDAYLTETKIIDDVKSEETSNPECMLIVKCKLVKKAPPIYIVAHKIIDCWKNELRTSNHLYKVELKSADSTLENFSLTFATWHSIYLTGQIIVSN